MEPPRELDEHFFRRESARIVAALTRVVGVRHLALVEDVTQDALCRAVEVWTLRGVPERPGAWLAAAAKNRAIDALRRERTARTLEPELARFVESEASRAPALDEAIAEALEPGAIRDEQLRMMFSCCHPRLPVEAQLALVLNVLCGFGAAEVAAAMLTGRAAIEKRIARGKKVLAGARTLFDLDDADFGARLPVVRRALYVLFQEGYHGASPETPVRAELCAEAMHLVSMLLDHPPSATPATCALAALMWLHAARLPARIDDAGDLSALVDQDRSRWDARLIARGLALLERSASGEELSSYHLESAIAATHASARSVEETDWATIVSLYDRLIAIDPSPVAALSRAIAIGRRDGPEHGLAAIEAIADRARLARSPFLPAAIAELELARGDAGAAGPHFREALALARNDAERRFLERRLAVRAGR